MIRNVFIARNRNTGFHSLFEVIGSDNPVPATAPMDFDLAEHLLRWGTLDELVTTISESGPLVDRSIYKEENRRLSIDDAIEVVEESIASVVSRVATKTSSISNCALRGCLRRAAPRLFIRLGPPSRTISKGTALSNPMALPS